MGKVVAGLAKHDPEDIRGLVEYVPLQARS